jgi:predicted DNA-binding protein (MmcQ/YjbR family)
MTREDIETIALARPGATKVVLWRRLDVYKVGGKVFASYGESDGLSFKASDIAYEVLTREGPGRRAPGFVPGHWVNIALADLEPCEAATWLAESHRLVAANLTRKQRAELGLA